MPGPKQSIGYCVLSYLPKGFRSGIDYSFFARHQAGIQAIDQLMMEQQFVVGPLGSWLSSFIAWAETSTEYR